MYLLTTTRVIKMKVNLNTTKCEYQYFTETLLWRRVHIQIATTTLFKWQGIVADIKELAVLFVLFLTCNNYITIYTHKSDMLCATHALEPCIVGSNTWRKLPTLRHSRTPLFNVFYLIVFIYWPQSPSIHEETQCGLVAELLIPFPRILYQCIGLNK